jgi:hypothetical protein
MPATKPRPSRDLIVFEVDDEAVVYDPREHLLHHLDAASALVLQLCDGTATVRQTIADLAEAQGVPAEAIERKVRSLVRELRRAGVLTSTREEEPAPTAEDKREQVRREVPRND